MLRLYFAHTNWLGAAAVYGAAALGAAFTGPPGDQKPAPIKPGQARVAEPVTYEHLSVFPLVSGRETTSAQFVTLDDALTSGAAVITEQGAETLRRSRDGRPPTVQSPDTEASVNRLLLVNRGTKPLMLLAGEIVSGGKQDRVIAKDRIIAPGSEPLPLDVFCVEQGRWSSGSRFDSAKLMAHPSVREQVTVQKEQSAVWSALRRGTTASSDPSAAPPAISSEMLGAVVASAAPTGAYRQIYQSDRVGPSVATFAAEMERRFARARSGLGGGRVVGVVVANGGEIAWSDTFASEELFDRYWPKLLRSYVVEALARSATRELATVDQARAFLDPVRGRETVESEPGVYSWRQVTGNGYAEIELLALAPVPVLLHRVKIQRTGE